MTFKFITLNIWHGKLLENALQFIHEENPDIVSLQEVYNTKNKDNSDKYRLYDLLRKKLGFSYGSYAPAYIANIKNFHVEEGNAVFSRYPIVESTTVFYDIAYKKIEDTEINAYSIWPRNLQLVKVNMHGKSLYICNTHGIWGNDGLDNERRLKMSKTIVENIKDKSPLILSGDFNVSEHTKSVKNIEKYLINVFKNRLTSTFNMKHKTNQGYASAVVDMIFVSKDIIINKSYSSDSDVSDHKPLIITAEL